MNMGINFPFSCSPFSAIPTANFIGKISYESSLFNTIKLLNNISLTFYQFAFSCCAGKVTNCCGTNSYWKKLSTSFWKLKTLKYRMLSHSMDALRFSGSSCSIWRRAMPSIPKTTQSHPFAGRSFPVSEQKS